jgi:hypothetical protein
LSALHASRQLKQLKSRNGGYDDIAYFKKAIAQFEQQIIQAETRGSAHK